MSKLTYESDIDEQNNATRGRYGQIRGKGDSTDEGFHLADTLVGVALAPGTYRYRLPCAGNAALIATLNPSTVTGACTARIFTPLAVDGLTIDASISATSISLAQGVQVETSQIAITGERVKILELVVPGGGALQFSVAEFRTLVQAPSSGGGGGGGGAATVADGADVAEGSVADAAVVTNATGTISAKLRGLVAILAAVADTVNGFFHFNLKRVGNTAVDANTGTVSAGTQRMTLATDIALPAGELHMGEVGGNTTINTPALAVTAGAYTAGFAVGGILTLTSAMRKSGGSGVLQSLMMVDHANQKAQMEVLIFDSNPAGGTYADHGAAAIGDADIAKLLHRISIAATDWVSLGGTARAIVDVNAIAKPVVASGSANLFMVIITLGTPTFANTTDLEARLGFFRD